MHKPVVAMVVGRMRASMLRFRDDERGSMALIILFTFLAMIMFGGIAVDVMRFETRRVAMQQTLDRAALAAAGLPDTDDLTKVREPVDVANDWFAKTDLEAGFMVDFSKPTVTAINVPGKREVTISAKVTSHNFFMGIFSPRDYLEGPTSTKAAQGVANVEVMLVLDITGSMGDPIVPGKSKLTALKESAKAFVDLVEEKDKKNGVSIGIVPYSAQVNVPPAIRDLFAVTNKATWNGVPDAGMPTINCFEFPVAGFTSMGVPLATSIPMAAYADAGSGTTTNGTYVAPQGHDTSGQGNVPCRANAEKDSTPYPDHEMNQIMLPTKDGQKVKDKIDRLTAYGTTYIAVGMRWGTALMDQAARPIYDALLAGEIDPVTGKKAMEGRPANNGDGRTRKIIVLMTDGEHVNNNHVLDTYKSGLSPIWLGEDGNYAIRFVNPASPAAPIRPGSGSAAAPASIRTCSGWTLTNYANREYFVPHLKRNNVNLRLGADPEGVGTGASTANSCDPQAWLASPSWTGSGTTRRLDWSEVWPRVRVSWVAQQLFVRSGVTGWTNYGTVMGRFRATYLSNTTNMDELLRQNCVAAREQGVEVFGIMFDDNPTDTGIAAMQNCVSRDVATYYYEPKKPEDLLEAFNDIATDIADLRLTQ
jgi:Flp pilus assembly protein TadG